jgi:hypothetical protein
MNLIFSKFICVLEKKQNINHIVLLHFRASFCTIQDEDDLRAMNIQQYQ